MSKRGREEDEIAEPPRSKQRLADPTLCSAEEQVTVYRGKNDSCVTGHIAKVQKSYNGYKPMDKLRDTTQEIRRDFTCVIPYSLKEDAEQEKQFLSGFKCLKYTLDGMVLLDDLKSIEQNWKRKAPETEVLKYRTVYQALRMLKGVDLKNKQFIDELEKEGEQILIDYPNVLHQRPHAALPAEWLTLPNEARDISENCWLWECKIVHEDEKALEYEFIDNDMLKQIDELKNLEKIVGQLEQKMKAIIQQPPHPISALVCSIHTCMKGWKLDFSTEREVSIHLLTFLDTFAACAGLIHSNDKSTLLSMKFGLSVKLQGFTAIRHDGEYAYGEHDTLAVREEKHDPYFNEEDFEVALASCRLKMSNLIKDTYAKKEKTTIQDLLYMYCIIISGKRVYLFRVSCKLTFYTVALVCNTEDPAEAIPAVLNRLYCCVMDRKKLQASPDGLHRHPSTPASQNDFDFDFNFNYDGFKVVSSQRSGCIVQETQSQKLFFAKPCVQEFNSIVQIQENWCPFIIDMPSFKGKYILFPLYKEAKEVKFDDGMLMRLGEHLMQGLDHMHKHNWMHRDIKLENIVYDESTKTFKIIDFGHAVRFSKKIRTLGVCGTPGCQAPEVLDEEASYTEAIDIWSAGILLSDAMLNYFDRSCYHAQDSPYLIRQKILKKMEVEKQTCTEFRKKFCELIQTMLQEDPSARPSASQALEKLLELKAAGFTEAI